MKENLNSYTVVELRKLVRDHGGKRIYGINKAQLVSSLRELLEQEEHRAVNSAAVDLADSDDGKCTGAASSTSDCADLVTTSNSAGSRECSKDCLTEQRPQAENTQSPQYTHSAITTNSPKDRTEYGSPNRRSVTNRQSRQSFSGILEVNQEGFGFARRNENLKEQSVYVSQSLIRRFHMRTGDFIEGSIRAARNTEKNPSLTFVNKINGELPINAIKRPEFECLTPVFPDSRLRLETPDESTAMRIMDLFSPIGKGQRGLIVSPPKAGKTTLLKQAAASVIQNHPEETIIILLIDERPEEVTDIRESLETDGSSVEVCYSTFDEPPEHHIRTAEMVLERAKRLVEHGRDVMILLDSITRLTRAYNLAAESSGKTLSGGLDSSALHFPKKFFGAARNIREGGSLTILATALVDTGSRMDDVIYEEFKGTGNMEIVLDRRLAERRIYPAIDIVKSGTRRDDLLLSDEEQEAMRIVRKGTGIYRQDDMVERVSTLLERTSTNEEAIRAIIKNRKVPELSAAGK